MNFEVFSIRVNSAMTLSDFKNRIAQKYETFLDNIIISVGDKEYRGGNNEQKLTLQNDLHISEKTIVKLTFKA